MLRFTKRADYGLMAVHYIAVHEDNGVVSAKRIAEELAAMVASQPRGPNGSPPASADSSS